MFFKKINFIYSYNIKHKKLNRLFSVFKIFGFLKGSPRFRYGTYPQKKITKPKVETKQHISTKLKIAIKNENYELANKLKKKLEKM